MAISKADYQRLADERNALRDEVARLKAVAPKVIEKPVEVIKTRTVEVPVEVVKVEYRDNETALVKKLQAKVAKLLAENAALKARQVGPRSGALEVRAGASGRVLLVGSALRYLDGVIRL